MGGLQDVQVPAGPQAAALFELWIAMLAVCVVVFLAVMAALAMSVRRAAPVTEKAAPDLEPHPRIESKMRRIVGYALATSTVLLFVLLVASFTTDRAIARLPLADAVHIDLIGHQFWWEARYEPTDPALTFTTANELHVPVGRPVLLTLRSDDVIHSFWMPSLHGKKDMIPGRESTFAFRADKAGVYRGQCAEFCGYQHAHMTLYVVADEPSRYAEWIRHQRQPAPAPATELQRRGQDVVVRSTCAMCHAIAGTPAQGRRAPDLTHIASRMTLGAGVVANDEKALREWIANAQEAKPGVNMPRHALSPEDLEAVSAYLGALQ
jgi:cytochrome c oxidase subunit II